MLLTPWHHYGKRYWLYVETYENFIDKIISPRTKQVYEIKNNQLIFGNDQIMNLELIKPPKSESLIHDMLNWYYFRKDEMYQLHPGSKVMIKINNMMKNDRTLQPVLD